jgi:hypothetical protein
MPPLTRPAARPLRGPRVRLFHNGPNRRLGHQSSRDCHSTHKDNQQLKHRSVAATWFNAVNTHKQHGGNNANAENVQHRSFHLRRGADQSLAMPLGGLRRPWLRAVGGDLDILYRSFGLQNCTNAYRGRRADLHLGGRMSSAKVGSLVFLFADSVMAPQDKHTGRAHLYRLRSGRPGPSLKNPHEPS